MKKPQKGPRNLPKATGSAGMEKPAGMKKMEKNRQPTARTLLNDLGLFPHLKKKWKKTPKTRQVTNAKTPQNPPGKPSKKPQK